MLVPEKSSSIGNDLVSNLSGIMHFTTAKLLRRNWKPRPCRKLLKEIQTLPEISGEHGGCALPYIGSALPGRVGRSGTFAVFPAYRFDRPG
jgi:hypothetical protein